MILDDRDIDLVQRFLYTLGLLILLEGLGLGEPVCQDILTDRKELSDGDIQIAIRKIIKKKTARSANLDLTGTIKPQSFTTNPEKTTATICFAPDAFKGIKSYQGIHCVRTVEPTSGDTKLILSGELFERGLTLADDTDSSTDNASKCLEADIKDGSSHEDICEALDQTITSNANISDEIITRETATEPIKIKNLGNSCFL